MTDAAWDPVLSAAVIWTFGAGAGGGGGGTSTDFSQVSS